MKIYAVVLHTFVQQLNSKALASRVILFWHQHRTFVVTQTPIHIQIALEQESNITKLRIETLKQLDRRAKRKKRRKRSRIFRIQTTLESKKQQKRLWGGQIRMI